MGDSVSEDKRKLDPDDPIIIELVQRVARLEAKVDELDKDFSEIKKYLNRIDYRIWFIVTGIIISILIQLILR